MPAREVSHSEAMSRAYPSKPMSLCSTIWDGSQWAARGGQKPINYNFAPFVASFKELEIDDGCAWNQNKTSSSCSSNNQKDRQGFNLIDGQEFIKLSQQQKIGTYRIREKFSVMPPECKERKP